MPAFAPQCRVCGDSAWDGDSVWGCASCPPGTRGALAFARRMKALYPHARGHGADTAMIRKAVGTTLAARCKCGKFHRGHQAEHIRVLVHDLERRFVRKMTGLPDRLWQEQTDEGERHAGTYEEAQRGEHHDGTDGGPSDDDRTDLEKLVTAL